MTDTNIVNRHLEPVFKILLTGLEKSEIDYWVYGGVSVAALAGRFIRPNADVDIFVKKGDFEKAKEILEELCEKHHFGKPNEVERSERRDKLEIKNERKEGLSVVTVKVDGQTVRHMFGNISQDYPSQILNKVERKISGFRFFTTTDEYIKIMFKDYLKLRVDKPLRTTKEKIKRDAKEMLTDAEFSEFCRDQRWN
ncbi:MAG: hypothetical protein WCG83_02340 [Candidatus Peregrinibacteria bacterium]